MTAENQSHKFTIKVKPPVTNDENIMHNIMKKSPLKNRLKTRIQMHYLMSLGGTPFISLDEQGNENEQQMEFNKACYLIAQPLIDSLMKAVDEWEKDGAPGSTPTQGEGE